MDPLSNSNEFKLANILQWLEHLTLQDHQSAQGGLKPDFGTELQKNRRKTKYSKAKKNGQVKTKSDTPLVKDNATKYDIPSSKDTVGNETRSRIRKIDKQSNKTESEKNEEHSNDIDNGNPRRSKKRPSFNRQWIVKPVETIVRLPRSMKEVDSTKDCAVCQVRFRSERVLRSHLTTVHGSGFKLEPLLDFDPRNQRIDRQVFKLFLKQLPMTVPSFSITISNQATVTVLLNSVYIFDGNVQLLPVFAGDQVLRMVPGYCFEDEVSLDDLVLVDGRSYSIIITATPIVPDKVLNRQIVEQYHFTEKEAKTKGKKTELKLTKLPPYEIPRSVVTLYKSGYKINDSYTQLEKNLLQFVENSQNENSLTLGRYSNQLTVLNQIEAQHLLEEYFSYTILEPVIVPKENSRYYTISTQQFKQRPSLLSEDVKVVFLSQGKHRMEKAYGVVEKITAQKITFCMQEFVDTTKVAKVMFLLNRTTFQLERKALMLMSTRLIKSICLPDAIAGGPLESFTSFQWIRPSVASNEEQMVAVRNIVNQTSFPAPYILFGPPGTGKTSTLVEAIGQIHKLRPTVNILVAAPSNFAANELTSRLLDVIPEETIFRFFAFSCLKKINDIDWDVLDVSNLAGQSYSNICYEDIYMCRVIVATLTTAGRLVQANIKSKHFSYVFIDECGSAKEISSLIPIAGLATSGDEINASVVLAGDPKQLGPVIQYEYLKQTTHGLSMLERMTSLPLYARDPTTKEYNPKAITQLRDSFRSHDKLLQFCNGEFYEGQLRAKAPHEVKNMAIGWWRLPNRKCPLIFHPIIGQTKSDKTTFSLFNKDEANQVMFYVSDLLTKGINGKPVNQSDIGILSPYARQVIFIKQLCSSKEWFDIEIGSAEQYQGREKAIMIISTVRSGCDNVGFLADARRLNVTLTRARSLMIVIGNRETLQLDPLWRKFIEYCRENGAIAPTYDKRQSKSKKNTSLSGANDARKIDKSGSSKTPKTTKKSGKKSKIGPLQPAETSTPKSSVDDSYMSTFSHQDIQQMINKFYELDFDSSID